MDAFLARLVLSVLLGGLAVAAFTAVAERRGSRLGGLLLSFPIKVVVALAVIGLNEGAAFAAEAALAVPAGLAMNVSFLAVAALLAQRASWRPALAGGAIAWLALSAVWLLVEPHLAVATLVWALIVLVGVALLSRVPGARLDRRARVAPRGVRALVVRGLVAGLLIALSLVLARTAGPFVSGLASVFPSAWTTTMLILTREHEPAMTAATVRVMLVGSAAPVAFGAVAALAMPHVGLALGIVAALGAAGVASAAAGALLARADGAGARVEDGAAA